MKLKSTSAVQDHFRHLYLQSSALPWLPEKLRVELGFISDLVCCLVSPIFCLCRLLPFLQPAICLHPGWRCGFRILFTEGLPSTFTGEHPNDALKNQTHNRIIQKQIIKREDLFSHECFIKHVLQ